MELINERMERLQFWCQHVIPLVYDDSLSYYELLCKVVTYLNELIDNQNNIKDVLQIHTTDINTLKNDVSFLFGEIEKVKNGDYISLYLSSLERWIEENLSDIVESLAKFVWFGLSDDGYFIAVIPDNWKEITFSTTQKGELTLTY